VVLLTLTAKASDRLAEVAFLLLVIAGLWLVASEIPAMKMSKARRIVAGVLIAASGVLLLVATHWGRFG
jgi:hypothetical protein